MTAREKGAPRTGRGHQRFARSLAETMKGSGTVGSASPERARSALVVLAFAASPDLAPSLAMLKGVWLALANGYVATTGVTEVDDVRVVGDLDTAELRHVTDETLALVSAHAVFDVLVELAAMDKAPPASMLQRITCVSPCWKRI